MLPKKRQRERSGIERAPKRDWPKHRAFVRRHQCCAPGCEDGPIECAHVRLGGNAGTGIKPPDWQTVSLCQFHHRQQHAIGHIEFDARYAIDSLKLAREFALASTDAGMREAMRAEGLL